MKLPAQYLEAQRLIKQRGKNKAQDMAVALQAEQERQNNELSLLADATVEYLNTGIVNLSYRGYIYLPMHGVGWGQRGFVWSQYFRRIAKEMGRPFVTVAKTQFLREQQQFVTHYISVPVKAYTRPLVSAFHLLPPEVCRTYHNKSTWKFSLMGEGSALFEPWLERCATDPVMRKALRL